MHLVLFLCVCHLLSVERENSFYLFVTARSPAFAVALEGKRCMRFTVQAR